MDDSPIPTVDEEQYGVLLTLARRGDECVLERTDVLLATPSEERSIGPDDFIRLTSPVIVLRSETEPLLGDRSSVRRALYDLWGAGLIEGTIRCTQSTSLVTTERLVLRLTALGRRALAGHDAKHAAFVHRRELAHAEWARVHAGHELAKEALERARRAVQEAERLALAALRVATPTGAPVAWQSVIEHLVACDDELRQAAEREADLRTAAADHQWNRGA
jgi:hypothetical protein